MVRSFYFLVSHSSRVSVISIVSSFPYPRPTLDVDATGENPEYTFLRLETGIETAYLDPRGTGYGDGFTVHPILQFHLPFIHPSTHLCVVLVSVCSLSVWMESGIEVGCCGKGAYLSSGSWSDAARVGKFPRTCCGRVLLLLVIFYQRGLHRSHYHYLSPSSSVLCPWYITSIIHTSPRSR